MLARSDNINSVSIIFHSKLQKDKCAVHVPNMERSSKRSKSRIGKPLAQA